MGANHQTRTIHIVLAGDQASLRADLRRQLESQPDLKVVGEAQNGVRALTLAGERKPDIILLDLTMPGIYELDVLRTIKGIAPRSKIVALHDDESYLQQALALGAAGYVVRDAVGRDLLNVIRAVLTS